MIFNRRRKIKPFSFYLLTIGITIFFSCNQNQQAKQNEQPINQVVSTKAELNTKMVYIEGAEFIMGTCEQSNTGDALPAQKVKVDGFWIEMNTK